jgi:hypothetical protein
MRTKVVYCFRLLRSFGVGSDFSEMPFAPSRFA